MKRSVWHRGVSVAAALAVALVAACRPHVVPMSEADRHGLAPMALAVGRFQPSVVVGDINFGPAEGFASGAARGAGRAVGVMPGLSDLGSCSGSFCGAGAIVLLALWASAAVVGAAAGGAMGAAAAEPAEAGKAAMDDALLAVRQGAVQDSLRDSVVAAAGRIGKTDLAVLPGAGPDGIAETPGYAGVRESGRRSVLEVSLLEIGLAGADAYDQSLAFYMRARARVVRVSDGAELYSHEITNLGARRGIRDWGAMDGRRVQEEVERGYRRLAEQIVEEVFLIWNPS